MAALSRCAHLEGALEVGGPLASVEPPVALQALLDELVLRMQVCVCVQRDSSGVGVSGVRGRLHALRAPVAVPPLLLRVTCLGGRIHICRPERVQV
jgi:hypothetical protein